MKQLSQQLGSNTIQKANKQELMLINQQKSNQCLQLLTSLVNNDTSTLMLVKRQTKLTYVNANEGISIRNLSKQAEESVQESITNLIGNLQSSLNTKEKLSDVQVFEIVHAIIDSFGRMTLDELILCFYKAKIGAYGTDFNRLDILTISQWLNKFLNDPGRVQAIREKKQREEEESRNQNGSALSPEESQIYGDKINDMINIIYQKTKEKHSVTKIAVKTEQDYVNDFTKKIKVLSIEELEEGKEMIMVALTKCLTSEIPMFQTRLKIIEAEISKRAE